MCEVVVVPDGLRETADVVGGMAQELRRRTALLERETAAVRLNGRDPGFAPSVFTGASAGVRGRLRRAADACDGDVRLMDRTVDQAVLADNPSSAHSQFSLSNTLAAVLTVPGPKVPLDPLWYLEQLGKFGSYVGERVEFSASGCVGLCTGVAFQDGVLTGSVAAGMAYSVSADAMYKQSIADEDRDKDFEAHRYFFATPWISGEATKEVLDDDAESEWAFGAGYGPSPLKFGGGWVYQWNRRWELWK